MSTSPRDILTNDGIAAVSKLEVRDEKGQAVTFGSLFEGQKTVIIFIRMCFYCRRTFLLSVTSAGHFFCGVRTSTSSKLQSCLTHVDIRAVRYGLRPHRGSWLIVSQAYISRLASIPPETFTNIGLRVIVIGCGEWDVIPFYKGAGRGRHRHPTSQVSPPSGTSLTRPTSRNYRVQW